MNAQDGKPPDQLEPLAELSHRLARLEKGVQRLIAKLSQRQPSAPSPPPIVHPPSPASIDSAGDDASSAVATAPRRRTRGTRLRPISLDGPIVSPLARPPSGRNELPRSTTAGSSKPTGPPTSGKLREGQRHRLPPAWYVSVAAHVAVLLSLALLTFALDSPRDIQLTATVSATVDSETDVTELTVEAFDELPTSLADEVSLTAEVVREEVSSIGQNVAPIPLEESARGDVANLLDSLDDLGAMDATSGSAPRGLGRDGTTNFFGVAGRGTRVAFVVDGSNSMTGGRFETTLNEIARAVAALKPRQQFFVIFFSDMAYPMFHPLAADTWAPATNDNKRRLVDWLPTVEMCTGGRIVDALAMALDLEPHVIYLLSDGEMSERAVRSLVGLAEQDVILHTLGMTVTGFEPESKLRRIATAFGGTYAPVAIHPTAREMARRQAVKKNRTRGEVWGVNLPAVPSVDRF